MQHHNLIHRHRSKTILDHAIQKQDYSWSCKTLSSSLSTWTLLGSFPNPVLIICDRRERAQLLWVSHSYPFRIACLTFLASIFPFCKLSLLSLDILLHKGGAFSQGELLDLSFCWCQKGEKYDIQKLFLLVGFVIKMHSFLHSTYWFNLQYSFL
jgi:hypothetical protein